MQFPRTSRFGRTIKQVNRFEPDEVPVDDFDSNGEEEEVCLEDDDDDQTEEDDSGSDLEGFIVPDDWNEEEDDNVVEVEGDSSEEPTSDAEWVSRDTWKQRKKMMDQFKRTIPQSVDGRECGICRLSLSESNIELNCGHLFHEDCIQPWFIVRSYCPICKIPVSAIDEMEVVDDDSEEGSEGGDTDGDCDDSPLEDAEDPGDSDIPELVVIE